VDWSHGEGEKFATSIRIETLDRVGVMANISSAFSERKINIEEATIRSRPGASAVWELVVDVADVEELQHVIRIVTGLPDVISVVRPGPDASQPAARPRVRRSTGKRAPTRK
jgi:GTP diphosphokinase / guanosine-3',5'-bis(diphosphate) 3'-diphosphatase